MGHSCIPCGHRKRILEQLKGAKAIAGMLEEKLAGIEETEDTVVIIRALRYLLNQAIDELEGHVCR